MGRICGAGEFYLEWKSKGVTDDENVDDEDWLTHEIVAKQNAILVSGRTCQ